MSGARAGDVLVVCGLTAEARVASGPGVRVLAGGGRSAALAERIDAALAGNEIEGLASFGVAGALDSTMRPGTLVVADAVIVAGEVYFTDDAWSDAMGIRLPGAKRSEIAGVDAIAASAADKARLLRATGAVAVDMESHVVARAALRRGLPFVVMRAIADPSHQSLPPAAGVAMRDDGGLALGAIARSIWRTPSQLPDLIRLGADTRAAMTALRRAVPAVGRRLGFVA